MKKKKAKKTKKVKRAKPSKKPAKKTRRPKKRSKKARKAARLRKLGGLARRSSLRRAKAGKLVTPEKLQELLDKGRSRGFITYSEILYSFPDIEKDIQGLEFLYDELEKRGIEVKESREFLEIDEKKKEAMKLASEAILDP